jgi:ubiquinone/menaquinone biosynthesis C-methylase UbiE
MGALLAERYGWRLAGVDYEEWAMTRALDRGLDARRCDVDAESLPFGNAEFRLVLFDAVLEHLYNPRRALSELARVTAPGGLLILGTPNASELGLRVRVALGANPFERLNRFNAIHDHARMSECAVLYTPHEIIRALQDTFDPVSVKWTHLFAPDHQSRSSIRNLVTPVRLAICRAFPSLSGYFYLVLRRKAGL